MDLQHTPREPAFGAGLGLACTAALAGLYLTFTALGAFAPHLLAEPVGADSPFNLAMALGLVVIVAGFALTALYAVLANRRERAAERRPATASLGAEGLAR